MSKATILFTLTDGSKVNVNACATKVEFYREKKGEVRDTLKVHPLKVDNRITRFVHRSFFFFYFPPACSTRVRHRGSFLCASRAAVTEGNFVCCLHLVSRLRFSFSLKTNKIMEVLMDCYFDKFFEQMDRSSLASRHRRRQLVKFFSDLVNSVAEGERFQISIPNLLRVFVDRNENS